VAKRDPEISARNRIVAGIKEELRQLLPTVLEKTGVATELSLT
jgi:hypothetical protein